MRPAFMRLWQSSSHHMTVHVTKVTPTTTRPLPCLHQQMSAMSTSLQPTDGPKKNYRLLVVGGGSGGCAIAAKFCKLLGEGNVAVVEPHEMHYYQAMWTLVGGGIRKIQDSGKRMESVLPSQCTWIKDTAVQFDPKNNSVTTKRGHEIKYDFLVVAMGMQVDYHLMQLSEYHTIRAEITNAWGDCDDWIEGAPEALKNDKRVVSNFDQQYVQKTFPALQAFTGGNAVFTVPNTPIKCGGAPQKIMYLAEHYFRKTGKREKADIIFNSAMGTIFSVKKYADSLNEVARKKGIQLNYKLNLVSVDSEKSEAVFKDLESDTGRTETFKYDFLHVVPPMSSPDILKQSCLVDGTDYLNVNKHTLQHIDYPNIFGLGDCTNLPTSKTAAAVASQTGTLWRNLHAAMLEKELPSEYGGYTSCPLLTSYGKCILAEFDYDALPKETFPFDQAKERRSMYIAKKDIMPQIYWRMFVKGTWEGPGTFRKILHFGMGK